jgi:5-formaminoimidazole-4-carboxamide-1-beta-D-ribofuranosyl 5'-monophosphate synthetase
MIQNVKTVIKWQDEDGCVLGALRENDIELPKWGKKQFLRDEISRFITNLLWDANKIETPKHFKDYAIDSFKVERIVHIKSRTKGSYVSLKGSELSSFLTRSVL